MIGIRSCGGVVGALAVCAAVHAGSGVNPRPGDIVVAVDGMTVQFFLIDPISGDTDTISLIGVVSSVGGIDVADNGIIYFTEPDFGTVRKLNPQTGQITPVENGLSDPRDLVIDSIGRILVTEHGSGQVSRINEDNNSLVVVSEGGLLVGPQGIDLRTDGRIVVLDDGGPADARVVIVDPSSGAQQPLNSQSNWNSIALSVDPVSDIIAIANGVFGGISRLDPVTGAETAFGPLPGADAESLESDRAGSVLVGSHTGDVFRFNPASGNSEFIAGDLLGVVAGIAVAPTPGDGFFGSLYEPAGNAVLQPLEGGILQISGVGSLVGANGAIIRPGNSRVPAGYGVSFDNPPNNEVPNAEIELRLRGERNNFPGLNLGSVTLRKLAGAGQRRMLFNFSDLGSDPYSLHVFENGVRVFEGPFVTASFINFQDCGPVELNDPYQRLDVGIVKTFPAADDEAPFISLRFNRCQSITPLGGGAPITGDQIVIVRLTPEFQPARSVDEVQLFGRGLNAINVSRANIHKFGLEARADAGTPLDATVDLLRMARTPFGPTTEMGTRFTSPFPFRPQGIRSAWNPVIELGTPEVTTHGAAQPKFIEGNARGTINAIPDRDLGIVRVTDSNPIVSTHGGPEYDMAGVAPAAGDGEFTLVVIDDGQEIAEITDIPGAALAQVEEWPEAMGAVNPFYRLPSFSNPSASVAPPSPPSPFGSADEPQAFVVLQWPQDITMVIDGNGYVGDELLVGAEGIATPVDSVDAIAISTSGIASMTFISGLVVGLCPGDVNGDFEVDFADLNMVIANWETFPVIGTNGDANFDGLVDFADLNFVIANWQIECP